MLADTTEQHLVNGGEVRHAHTYSLSLSLANNCIEQSTTMTEKVVLTKMSGALYPADFGIEHVEAKVIALT